ncbi:spore coat protein CotJB [Paenibacillus sp. N3.4]|uniref:spore coat protein CotJB n=1 Tax=Paenibacillus sp. N3.4 TaxID=2603222 RepID=UPI0011CA72B5|nr:spore coat protein CotJB [Paenibacillus sp. N3.4]TXK75869.1 spore coat protein CotJB [Paenibacillus sp. N3.4]
MNPREVPEAYYQQLYDLQAVDFVLVELTLFLDTHPDDLGAIQQYNQFAQKRKQLVQQFEFDFGPLMPFGHAYTKQPWQWVETPWPWQV